ncbi:MAG: NAD(P)H-binding protein [Ardenticatenaceae bacterium]|nr:NAD(P)H-binding protein [Ardenticatenaceae bacterium]MCB8991337.1 NAD(P)H-binding protein [Ardenticatenaceae bacterium]
MQEKILIIGATGLLGAPVTHQLREAGFAVRVLTRNGAKAAQLFGDSVEVMVGDPTNRSDLDKALAGCRGVHINLNGRPEQIVAELLEKTAAVQGIRHITYISGATVSEETRWFETINYKFLAEEAIRRSGIPYTIFRPTWFMESLPMFVQDGRATIIGKQPTPFHWLSAADYARIVTAVYQQPDRAANQTLILYGPEGMTMLEALTRYCAVAHPDIKAGSMPFWMAKLLATMMRSDGMKTAVAMMAYFEKVGEPGQPTANTALGTPATTLDQWLAKQNL